MDQHVGRLINSIEFCLPITDVYCGHDSHRHSQGKNHASNKGKMAGK